MSHNFIIITQDEIDEKIAENIHSRELELMSYDFERQNHEAVIAKLGNITWSDTTKKYRGMTRDVLIARAQEDGLDSIMIQQLLDLNSLDHHKMNLEAVKAETKKSERHYENLLSSLPVGSRRDIAIAAVKAKKAEKKVV